MAWAASPASAKLSPGRPGRAPTQRVARASSSGQLARGPVCASAPSAAAQFEQARGKGRVVQRQQRRHALGQHRPDDGHLPAIGAVQRQKGDDVALGREPLARHLAVRALAIEPRGNGVLRVARGVELHAQLGARAAGAAFAHHGERRGHRLGHHVDAALVIDGFGQQRSSAGTSTIQFSAGTPCAVA
jgi:hypothetical protein